MEAACLEFTNLTEANKADQGTKVICGLPDSNNEAPKLWPGNTTGNFDDLNVFGYTEQDEDGFLYANEDGSTRPLTEPTVCVNKM